MLRIAILGSTRGSNLEPLIQEMQTRNLQAKVELVISNHADSGILDRAQDLGLPYAHIPAKGREKAEYEDEVLHRLAEQPIDLIVLIGYMRILSKTFIDQWENKIINVHPSLLPDFAGLMDMDIHRAVLAQGCQETGCSVHWVSEIVDAGPVLIQKKVRVDPKESPEQLKSKVQSQEVQALADAIQQICGGNPQ